jgi:hypothetical protein
MTWLPYVARGVLACVLAATLMVVVVEWLAGCGEVTNYADGTWRTNECVFMESPQISGRWDRRE